MFNDRAKNEVKRNTGSHSQQRYLKYTQDCVIWARLQYKVNDVLKASYERIKQNRILNFVLKVVY
jgi:hypothetical protein